MRLNQPLDRRLAFTRRPPPDFTSRRVKLRLFVVVAVIMLALAVIERARDPQMRRWFSGLGAPVERFDNRLASNGLRTAADPAGTFIAASDSKSDATAGVGGAPGLDAVERAWKQGWNDVVSRLPAEEQSLLFEMLHAAVSQRPLSPENARAAGELIEDAERLWNDYQAAAFQSVGDLKGDDRPRWIDVLRQVN